MSMHAAELARDPEHGPEAAPRGGVLAWILSTLREAPVTVPALAAIALFVAWATDQGGYPITRWAPGALVLLALVAIAIVVIGWRPAELPRAVKIALAC